MKNNEFEEFDLATIYQKLIAPSKPRMIKACDFFKQPDLITPLQAKMEKIMKQNSDLNN